jgi:hypothetical protein
VRVQVCRAQTAVLIRRKLGVVMRGADPSGADPGVPVEHAAHRDNVLSGDVLSDPGARTGRGGELRCLLMPQRSSLIPASSICINSKPRYRSVRRRQSLMLCFPHHRIVFMSESVS